MGQSAISVDTVFGLAFDVIKDPDSEKKSGFIPAPKDLGAGKELFGDLRLKGFAALLRIGFTKRLVIVGGNEGRYKNEIPVINRAWAIREMLIHDFDVNPDQVFSVASNSNTGGNIAAIEAWIKEKMLKMNDCAIVSNHYHLPRVIIDLFLKGLIIPTYSAEAFSLVQDEACKNSLICNLGSGGLAERMVEEMQGIAHKLKGTYKPHTNTSS